ASGRPGSCGRAWCAGARSGEKFSRRRSGALGSFRFMLPAVRTDEEWRSVVWNEQLMRPAAEDLAARLGLAGAGLRRYPDGSRPVYAVGDRRVLKLYPTVSAPDSITEARVLEHLAGRLPVATAELLAC